MYTRLSAIIMVNTTPVNIKKKAVMVTVSIAIRMGGSMTHENVSM